MSDHLEKLKEILIEDAGLEAVSQLTDDHIEQFDKILDVCAKIIYQRSKNGYFLD